MNTAIEAFRVSKIFRINQGSPRYRSLRDDFAGFLRASHKPTNRIETFQALKNINFTIKQGETIGIIGPNGAGKTTLLKILGRITSPSSGVIKLHGRVSSLLEVGTGFHPELTGKENIYLNGAILGMTRSEIKKKFTEIVSFAEIEKFLDTPVKHYSSGMYVRLAFSVAAHLDSEILLIDEVLAVGDIRFQKKCLGKMEQIGEQGRTILFVSHNMTAIKNLCQKSILITGGEILDYAKTAKVVNRYIKELGKNKFFAEWKSEQKAPQNMSMVLKKVQISNTSGKMVHELSSDDSFNVELFYMVKYKGAHVGLTLVFYDSEGNCILGSINNKEQHWYGKDMQQRFYKSVCMIPSNFFNNGVISLSVILFGGNYSDPVTVGDVLRFEIDDGVTVRGDYYGEYKGVVRPDFHWNTSLIEK